ncbi:MAG: hypothetical protein IT383_02305 [Deltaproteobacteria bacterium]|nr:hypothetical protein [Deltaproteobacteria bacterium]
MPNKVLCVVVGAHALVTCACASARTEAAGDVMVVTDEQSGAELWRGPATFVLRPPARVVALPGLGELQVADQGSRLVWAKEGLARLVVLAGDQGCRAADARRICCRAARFSAKVEGAARPVRIDGCADENDLLESRLGAVHGASVGPVTWRRRCAPLPPPARGCEVRYLALRTAEHEGYGDAAPGFSFSWDGDRFLACFLERDAGRYRLELIVEDGCGAAGKLSLTGDSAELD